MVKKLKRDPFYRIFLRIIDKSKPIIKDTEGGRWASTKWKEVSSVNLGSVKNPNRKIIEIRLEPIEYERKPARINLNDFFEGPW